MKRFIFLALFSISLTHSVQSNEYADVTKDNFIVGGMRARPGQFPHIVSIQVPRNSGLHSCGGSLISIRHVLTAGHCIYRELIQGRIESTSFRTGSVHVQGGTKYRIAKIFLHPHYDPITSQNDIAILLSTRPVKLGPEVKPIPLNHQELPINAQLQTAGWGSLRKDEPGSPYLMFHKTAIYDKRLCKNIYSDSKKVIWPGNLCTFTRVNIGSCRGDAGGPLVYKNQLAGIISFGIPCAAGAPDVFTKVSKYVKWIQEVAKKS